MLDMSKLVIIVDLNQGLALNSTLFASIMDDLTRLQEEVLLCMLFVDDNVLIDETKIGVNARLRQWRNVLESKHFKKIQIKKKGTRF